MASKTTLNAKNLESLGAAALAALLIEISTGSAGAKRRLRLALAGGQGPKEAAAEVRKRLIALGKSRAKVGWRQRKGLTEDLTAQSRAILDVIAPADAAEALDLLWHFVTLANGIFDRCDDQSGALMELFRNACLQIAPLALRAEVPPARLADRVMDALIANGHGQFDGVIAAVAPALGAEGLEVLKTLVLTHGAQSLAVPPKSEWRKIGFGPNGPIYAHQLEDRHRKALVDLALQDIADAQGDVDAFIARLSPQARQRPAVACEIAQRLLAAARPQEALEALDTATPEGPPPEDWREIRLAALDALGRLDEGQTFRWHCFARSLALAPLRAYLKRLPDFEDIEAEERALAHAQGFANATQALSFLIQYPALPLAASLVESRIEELNGDDHLTLCAAAEALAGRFPLAAVLLLRRMIDFSLSRGQSSRYGHAARHLEDCARLEPMIEAHGTVLPHAVYLERLRREHPRKSAFWQQLG